MCKKIKFLLSIIILFGIIILTNEVYAASASISASNNNLEPGQNTTITVSVSSTEAWNLKVSSSGGKLSGNLSSADAMGSEVTQNIITANFASSNEGSYTITLSGEITGSDLVKQSVSKSITINVKAKEKTPSTPDTPSEPTTPTTPTEPATPKVSSNANLSNLGIRPSEYDFKGFRASKKSYEVIVPNEVSSVEIYASKQDSKATIKGTGKKNLQEGTNVFKIVVTAEDGTTKTYQLNVIRQVASTDITPNSVEDTTSIIEEQNTIGLSKLEVKGMKLTPEFAVDTYRYSIELENEEITTLEQIKELIVAEVNFEGGTFEITGEEKLEKEENEVILSVKDADGREIAIYTLIFKIKSVEDTAETTGILNETTGNIEDKYYDTEFEEEKIIIAVSILVILFIAVKSSITSYKQRKILEENGLIKERRLDEEEKIEEDNNDEIIDESETSKPDSNEENKDYIEDIFKTSQMSFEADDKDFVKKKRGRGKHS